MNEQLEALTKRLDVLIALTAINVLVGKSQREQVELLSRAGLGPKQIAELVGTSANTVSVTLSQAKRTKKKPRIINP